MSHVLVINSGSSSIKFAVIHPDTGKRQLGGIAEALGSEQAQLKLSGPDIETQKQAITNADHYSALQYIWQFLESYNDLLQTIQGIGHRVVHGGERFAQSMAIDSEVIDYLDEISYLAPLHNPSNVACIKAIRQFKANWPQVAVFDTAFHQTMPKKCYLYPLPYELYQEYGVRRYGFHGTSHRYVTQRALELLNLPEYDNGFITAHLGNGCSVTAVHNGQSIETSMGFTPLEGVMMGTRSGSIDPEIPLFLQEHLAYEPKDVRQLLNKASGLQGVSQISNDMRQLWQAAEQGNDLAQLAIDMFCDRLVKTIASYFPLLPRFDGLVFTGGIGENDTQVRRQILTGLARLGFVVDDQANEEHGSNNQGCITQQTGMPAYVIPTDEEQLIAEDTLTIINQQVKR